MTSRLRIDLIASSAVIVFAALVNAQTLDPIQRPAVGIKVIRPELADEQGTGFVISVDNEAVYILTARHLFYSSDNRAFRENIKVMFALDPIREVSADWYADFGNLDLAVLRVPVQKLPGRLAIAIKNLPPTRVRSGDEPLKLREEIFPVGGKFQDWQLPRDTVSGLQDGTDRLDRFRFTGTGVHGGFSGSAIIDFSNRLIGVHLGGVPSDESYGRAQRLLDAIPVLTVNHIPLNKLTFGDDSATRKPGVNPGPAYPSTCLRPPIGLVAWWPGENAYDDILGGHSPSGFNGVTFAKGKVGEGFTFAPRGYMAVPASPLLALQRFTWSAWVRPDGPGPNNDDWGNVIVGQNIDGSHASVALEWSAKNGRFSFLSGSLQDTIYSKDIFAPGGYYFVAATYDGLDFRLFVNGAVQGQRRRAGGIPYSTKSWMIGSCDLSYFPNWTRTWNGVIDEVQVFNRPLSQAEIQSIYQAGSNGQCRPSQLAR